MAFLPSVRDVFDERNKVGHHAVIVLVSMVKEHTLCTPGREAVGEQRRNLTR